MMKINKDINKWLYLIFLNIFGILKEQKEIDIPFVSVHSMIYMTK